MAVAAATGAVGKIVQLRHQNGAADKGQDFFDHRMQAIGASIFNSTQALTVPQGWQPLAMVVHKRGGQEFTEPVWLGMPVFLEDKLRTSAGCVLAIEFIIGGRVGVNADSTVTVSGERSVANSNVSLKRVILRTGAMWKNTGSPLEIQTNGGVMGIKG